MKQFVDAIRAAIAEKNWYAALGLSLTMPDICGRLESPAQASKVRYVQWCDKYLTPRYTGVVGYDSQRHVFLHGEDCYALRCAVLHEGSNDILNQRARKALDSFLFIAPREGLHIHCNQSNSRLQLQVDVFSEDVCASVEEWLGVVAADVAIAERIGALMTIESTDGGIRF